MSTFRFKLIYGKLGIVSTPVITCAVLMTSGKAFFSKISCSHTDFNKKYEEIAVSHQFLEIRLTRNQFFLPNNNSKIIRIKYDNIEIKAIVKQYMIEKVQCRKLPQTLYSNTQCTISCIP